MKIVAGFPPCFELVCRTLGRPPATAVFTYGDRIYTQNATGNLDQPLLAHEETHSRQQEKVGGPEKWWDRYCHDRNFRLEQEIAAYRAQFRRAAELRGERYARRILLPAIAAHLAGPMYALGIRPERAARAIAG